MNADHLASERVTQDVLLLCGEPDTFQAPFLTRAQAKALAAARSVTVRIFTQAEHADQDCQMGNLDLACPCLPRGLQQSQPKPTGSLSRLCCRGATSPVSRTGCPGHPDSGSQPGHPSLLMPSRTWHKPTHGLGRHGRSATPAARPRARAGGDDGILGVIHPHCPI
jgi:hypothetical protein